MMSTRLYELLYLERFKENIFIYERSSQHEEIQYTYRCILQEVEKVLKQFRSFDIPEYVGIAIDMDEHSVDIIILLLSILNYNCYFYPFDGKTMLDIDSDLKMIGVSYVVERKESNAKSPVPEEEKDSVEHKTRFKFKILETIYYIRKWPTIVVETIENTRKRMNCVRGHHWCYVMKTSGTTNSAPRMVFVPYQCIAPNIHTLSDLLQIKQDDLILLSSPATFDPFIVEFWLSLQNGASLLITKRVAFASPNRLLSVLHLRAELADAVSRKGVTVMQMTPAIFRLFGVPDIRNTIFHQNTSLRCLLLGGDVFPSHSEIKDWFPHRDTEEISRQPRIFNIYGITEVSCWSLCYEYLYSNDQDSSPSPDNQIPLGKCLDNETVLRISTTSMDPDTSENPNQERGLLEIGSSTRCTYIPQLDGELDECRICDNSETLYRSTGDIVQRQEDGQIYFLGRKDNTIKRFGKRICLDSLSHKIVDILKERKINARAVFCWLRSSSKLVLCIIAKDRNLHCSTLLKNLLANHEQPDIIRYLDSLPISKHGKVDRRAIEQTISIESPLTVFKDFLQNTLGLVDEEQWASVNFRSCGGTSFQALSLATEISKFLQDPDDQKRILEMLLNYGDDETATIKDITEFLSNIHDYSPPSKKCRGSDPSTNHPSISIIEQWSCNLGKCVDASPTLLEKEDIVAVGSHSKLVVVVRASTGQLISQLRLPDRIECPVVFLEEEYPLAAVGCYDGYLYVFNWSEGTIAWSIAVGGMIKARPLFLKTYDLLLIGSYAFEYNLMAISLKKRSVQWRLKLGSKGIFSVPLLISNELVFVATLDGTYSLLQPENGSKRWLKKLQSPIFSTAIHLEEFHCIVIAEVCGTIAICSLEDGGILTSYQANGNVFSGIQSMSPEANSLLLIFGCYDRNLYVLRLTKIEKEKFHLLLAWRVPVSSPIYATPLCLPSSLYWNDVIVLISSIDGELMLYSLSGQRVLTKYNIKAEVFSTPSCHSSKDGQLKLFVGSRDNHLYAFCIDK